MIVTDYTRQLVDRGSAVRRIFELGGEFTRAGKRPVDLSLGNPTQKPPDAYYDALDRSVAAARSYGKNAHGYMPNGGYPETREAIATALAERFDIPFRPEGILMTAGAANGLDVALKTLIEPVLQRRNGRTVLRRAGKERSQRLDLDEVITIAPYFPEYATLIANNQGEQVVVHADSSSRLDLGAIEGAISVATKALIVNSPNNPTGVVYSSEELRALADLLKRKNEELGTEITVIEDAAYGQLLFHEDRLPTIMHYYPHCLFVESFSKALSVAGERIGYLALHPDIVPDSQSWNTLCAALTMNLRSRVVNAPALQQRVVGTLRFAASVSTGLYRRRADKLTNALRECGFQVAAPEGGFFLFARLPESFSSESEFRRCAHAGDEPLLYVPGQPFGGARYDRHIRLGACASDEDIERGCRRLHEICAHAGGR